MRNPHDFWRHSGFHLLARGEDGRLRLTEDFLRAYLLRPEIRPVEESGPGELALHQRLMDEPDLALGEDDLSAIEDADTRDNYRLWLRFRDRLLGSETIEACYLGLFAGKGVDVPPLFVEQLAHILIRNVLHGLSDSAEDALQARAAELFFREQKATLRDGQVLLADAETSMPAVLPMVRLAACWSRRKRLWVEPVLMCWILPMPVATGRVMSGMIL